MCSGMHLRASLTFAPSFSFEEKREQLCVFDMFPFSLKEASTSLILSLEVQLHKAAEVTERGEGDVE